MPEPSAKVTSPDLTFQNYPIYGNELQRRDEVVTFGGGSSDVVVLIRMDVNAEDHLTVTVGNGPPNDAAPEIMAKFLQLAALELETLGQTAEYGEAIAELRAQETE